jgi:hypothetical protein
LHRRTGTIFTLKRSIFVNKLAYKLRWPTKIKCLIILDNIKERVIHLKNPFFCKGQPTKPSITINKVPFEGDSATLTCSSTSTTTPRDPNRRMMYYWKVGNNNIPSDSRYTYSSTRNKLMISNITRNDSNKHFTCTAKEDVSNAYTSTISDLLKLDVYCEYNEYSIQ